MNLNINNSIVFFGSSLFSKIILEQLLIQQIPIQTIVTQPDKKIGRGRKVRFSELKQFALNQKLNLFQPQSSQLPATEQQSWQGKLAVVASYGKIIPSSWIKLFEETFNVHPSLVPKYRGVSPIQTAILNGDSRTGVSVIRISPKVDAGDIWCSEEFLLSPTIDYFQAHDQLAQRGGKLLLKAFSLHQSKNFHPQKQNHDLATGTQKFYNENLEIDWNQPAENIDRQCRALIAHGGMYTYLNDKRVKLLRTKISSSTKTIKPFTKGSWLRYNDGEVSIIVQTGRGVLTINFLQVEGKKAMTTQEFICGYGKTGQFTCH